MANEVKVSRTIEVDGEQVKQDRTFTKQVWETIKDSTDWKPQASAPKPVGKGDDKK